VTAYKAAASEQRSFFHARSFTVILGMTRVSLPLRASNEGLLRPRVVRAQGAHRAIPSPAGGLSQQPASVSYVVMGGGGEIPG